MMSFTGACRPLRNMRAISMRLMPFFNSYRPAFSFWGTSSLGANRSNAAGLFIRLLSRKVFITSGQVAWPVRIYKYFDFSENAVLEVKNCQPAIVPASTAIIRTLMTSFLNMGYRLFFIHLWLLCL